MVRPRGQRPTAAGPYASDRTVGMGRPDRTGPRSGKSPDYFGPVRSGSGLFALKIRTGPVRIEIKVSTPDLLLFISIFHIFGHSLLKVEKFCASGAVFNDNRRIVKMVCQNVRLLHCLQQYLSIKNFLCKNSSKNIRNYGLFFVRGPVRMVRVVRMRLDRTGPDRPGPD